MVFSLDVGGIARAVLIPRKEGDKVKQQVHPGVIAAAIVIVVLLVGYMGWKSMSKGAAGGNSGNPYSQDHPIPKGANGASMGGTHGPPSGGRGPSSGGGPMSGGANSGGAPMSGGGPPMSGGAPASGG